MTKPIMLRLNEKDIEALAKVGEPYGLGANAYARMVLSRFADLKPEHALDAVAAIPKEFFKGRPGRPPISSAGTHG